MRFSVNFPRKVVLSKRGLLLEERICSGDGGRILFFNNRNQLRREAKNKTADSPESVRVRPIMSQALGVWLLNTPEIS